MSKIKNWEQIDDFMQDGYKFYMKGDSVSACKEWKKAWELIILAMDSGNYHTIEDFDKDFDGLESVFNWSSEYEMELGNSISNDASFAQTRIDFCTEYLNRVPDSDKGDLNSLNMRRAIAETYFRMGMEDKGEKEFESLNDEYPTWGWGWIGWADEYSDRHDYDKAIKLLTHALDIDGVEEKDIIQERLKDVYQACGMNDKADSIVIEDHSGIPLSEIKNVANEAKSVINDITNRIAKTPERKEKVKAAPIPKKDKIPRNAPCPCGSGKKYKQCCGKNQTSV